MSSDSGIARFCASDEPLEQHRALGDHTEGVERREPFLAVGDFRGGPSEDAHDALVGQERAVHEVDEDFGAGAIETGDARRDRRARR